MGHMSLPSLYVHPFAMRLSHNSHQKVGSISLLPQIRTGLVMHWDQKKVADVILWVF